MNHPSAYISQKNCPISFVSNMGQSVEISIHPPSNYIRTNCQRILPSWDNEKSFWIVIVLQQSKCELAHITKEVEEEKERLREKFMRFGCDIAFNLRDAPHSKSYLTELIDPRTGYPLFSLPGQVPHDDTAAVKALLGYPVIHNQCRLLVHPEWGMAVYPSILISQAPPVIIEWYTKAIAPIHGWNDLNR
ncbi:MAG: methylmalonic aciduria and homocystinuria type D protein [Cyanobacteria bacterium P01_A01_bin.84]